MKGLISILLPLAAVVSFNVFGQSTASPENGKIIYDHWCVHCHGDETSEVLPGTAALGLKYRGELPAILEERTDLTPEYIRTVVRNGLVSMPVTRKTEVSDKELEDIVAYLTGN